MAGNGPCFSVSKMVIFLVKNLIHVQSSRFSYSLFSHQQDLADNPVIPFPPLSSREAASTQSSSLSCPFSVLVPTRPPFSLTQALSGSLASTHTHYPTNRQMTFTHWGPHANRKHISEQWVSSFPCVSSLDAEISPTIVLNPSKKD